jgi:hypothetical protein
MLFAQITSDILRAVNCCAPIARGKIAFPIYPGA